MIFTAPMPFKSALDAHEVKSLLPTSGRTRDLQQLGSAITQRALFSATVENVSYLQKLDDSVNGILTGQLDQATARLGLKQVLADMGYQSDPELAGGLQDLGSDPRIDLQLETNVATARGAGWFDEGQNPDVLDEWPAQELYDTAPGDSHHRRTDIEERWQKAGGKFCDDRMIALKNDPVWDKLGDPDLFPDGLGNPYSPFWFNTHWRERDIGRDEAQSLGLIDDNTELLPQPLDLNDSLQASPDVRSDELRQLLESTGLGSFTSDGVFKFGGGA
ncbi:MAG: hypothetical protein KGL39_48410 [Patescibacteria group bacterium]|nr:hypothetical protein [Patescibacteria group bacterium]